MATYTVKDPETGKTIRLNGDSPPTEQELEQIFSAVKEPVSAAEESGAKSDYWQDVRTNAKREAKDMAKGLPIMAGEALKLSNLPSDALKYPIQRLLGTPSNRTSFMEGAQSVKNAATGGIQSLVDMANMVTSPQESFRKMPVSTAMTAASLVVPALKAGFGLRSASAASQTAKTTAAAPGIMKRAFAKGARVAFGTPEEAVLARMENPSAVKTAFSHTELADQMVDSVKNFKETLSDLADNAYGKLRTSTFINEGAVPKETIQKVVKSARRELGGVYTPDAKSAAASLKNFSESLKKLKNTVSEAQVRELVTDLDNNINWSNPAASKTNQAMIAIRSKLNGILKKQNPEFASAMAPVDEATRVFNKVQDTFGIKHETARGFYATDQAVSKIQKSLNENKLHTKSVLDRFQKISGEDWETKIKNANARAAFERQAPGMGSTRANAFEAAGRAGAGALIGTQAGGPIGGAVGAIAGAMADVYGPSVAAKLVDGLASPRFSRYASAFESAAKKGARNVVATHTLLLETDKDYRKAFSGKSSEKSFVRSR